MASWRALYGLPGVLRRNTGTDSLRADGFAKKLCVVVSDVPMDGVSLGENQKGLLLDLDDRQVLYSKQALEKVYPASITKIMTAMLALKYGNMDECSDHYPGESGSGIRFSGLRLLGPGIR